MIGQSFGRPKTARARALCPSVDARHRQERLFHLRNCRQRFASKKPAREGPVGRFPRGLCCAGGRPGSLPAAARGTSEKPMNKRVVRRFAIAAPRAANAFDEAGWGLTTARPLLGRYGLSWPQEGQNLSVQRAPHAGQNHAAPSPAPGTRPGAWGWGGTALRPPKRGADAAAVA